MASNEHTIAPIPQADAEGTNKEHVRHHDISPEDDHDVADDGDLKKADVTPNAKGGDLASKWLASYTGPRPELTDKLSEKVRLKVGQHFTHASPVSSQKDNADGIVTLDRHLPDAGLFLHLLLSTTRQVECLVCGQFRIARRYRPDRN